jgi:hypothetical protein
MASKRGCAFCPETANLTGEHLFAEWIDRILTTSTSHYVFRDLDPKSGKMRQWRGRHLDRKFNAICETCNNTWMSDIDNAARDTLKGVIRYGAPVSFLRSGIESIARFTLKNAFVSDYMHDKPFFGSYSRKRFKECLQVPPGIYMWLGAVRTDPQVKHGILKCRYRRPDTNSRLGVQTYVFTWSAERLLLQLVAARWTSILMVEHGWPEMWQEKRLDTMFVPFWPLTRRHITWPSQQVVSHNHLHHVANRFTLINFHD